MRPRLEVADIVRRHGAAFCRSKGDRLSRSQRRVLGAIDACRTAALGGHAERCVDCGVIRCAYNSCLMGKIRNGELASYFAHAGTSFHQPRLTITERL
jgi:hypothetical protein